MNKSIFIKMITLMAIGICSIAGPASADTSKLIGSLVDTLGVTEDQATGGSGAVFREAKNNMSADDYTQLLKDVPGIDSLIAGAPEVGHAVVEVAGPAMPDGLEMVRIAFVVAEGVSSETPQKAHTPP